MNPEISVIIPHHLNENDRYLQQTLLSLSNVDHDRIEVLVTSSAPNKPFVPNWANLVWPMESKHYSEKINKSVALTNPESKYIVLGSDDLIFTPNCIEIMAEICGDYAVILNATSNCDNHYFFEGEIKVNGKVIPRFPTDEEITPDIISSIMSASSRSTIEIKQMFKQRYVCFYLTMIPRKVLDMVGPLDENFKTGYEDVDYCIRAQQKGIQCCITPNAFVLHLAGRTSSKAMTEQDKAHNPEYFKQKHGFYFQG